MKILETPVLVWVFAVTISLSRIFIGVHYPSDVLAGALIGCMVGLFWLYVEKMLIKFGFLKGTFESKEESEN